MVNPTDITTPYVLVVEDEEAIAAMTRYNLEKESFEVEVAEDGGTALLYVAERKPDIILLDWMLPGRSGVEICRQLRQKEETAAIPIIMITARGEEEDRVQGLDSGADDYIVKPFSPGELVARIRAVLRRTRPMLTGKNLEFAGVVIDVSRHHVSYGDHVMHLGPTEFRLLCHLMERPGQIFSRDQLLDTVWGQDVYVENRTVDVHIRRLRKALEDAKPGLERIIQTVRSAGYKIDEPTA